MTNPRWGSLSFPSITNSINVFNFDIHLRSILGGFVIKLSVIVGCNIDMGAMHLFWFCFKPHCGGISWIAIFWSFSESHCEALAPWRLVIYLGGEESLPLVETLQQQMAGSNMTNILSRLR